MDIFKMILGIVLMLVSLVLIVLNIMKDKPEKPSTIMGSGTYMNTKSKSEKEKMINIAIWVCITCIMGLVIALNIC